MGRIVHVSGQINKHQSLANYSRNIQANVLNLIQSLNGFVGDSSLTGASYHKAKEYINLVLQKLCQACYIALSSEIAANTAVISACGVLSGSDLIDEDTLLAEIADINIRVNELTMLIQSTTIDKGYYIALLSAYLQEKETLQELLNCLEDFDNQTRILHDNVQPELQNLLSGIKALSTGSNFGDQGFYIAKLDLEWTKPYIQEWEKIETQVMFKHNLSEQYGFDDRTTTIIYDLNIRIEEKYPDIDQTERDYKFARVLSQFSYSSENDPFTGAYEAGAGSINNYDTLGFFEELEMSEQDYNYLRYNIRLQNFISSENSDYSIEAIKKDTNNPDTLQLYTDTMILGLNLPEDTVFSDDEYLAKYEEIHEQYSEKPDFAHMMYTISANLVIEEEIKKSYEKFKVKLYSTGANEIISDVTNVETTIINSPIDRSISLWKSSEERQAYTGWLGDATWPGFKDNTSDLAKAGAVFLPSLDSSRYYHISEVLNSDVSFNNSDYMADLDAVNISNRLNDKNNLVGTITKYYENMQNDGNRAVEFLKNNNIEDVEEMIFDVAGVKDIDSLKEKWPTSALFIESLQAESNFMLEETEK